MVKRIHVGWKDLVRQFEASGQSARDFVKGRWFCVATLYRWKSRLREEEGAPSRSRSPGEGPRLLPLKVVDSQATRTSILRMEHRIEGRLEILVTPGVAISIPVGADTEYVASLVQAIRRQGGGSC